MSDCQRCAALRMIAEDDTLTREDMIHLARDTIGNQPPCGRSTDQFTAGDYQKIVSMPSPHYDPEDPDNPMLDILMPSVTRKLP
jgi:hypothetical protein